MCLNIILKWQKYAMKTRRSLKIIIIITFLLSLNYIIIYGISAQNRISELAYGMNLIIAILSFSIIVFIIE